VIYELKREDVVVKEVDLNNLLILIMEFDEELFFIIVNR
jgi:hypothetical protein